MDNAALDLIVKLCDSLAAQGINYCHWKSNPFLDRSASGDNDLDLLIARSHARRFEEILAGLGFKETFLPPGETLPGIRDFYGLDEKSGRLVHVHAHFQLILGSDLSKNYRLPLERVYLESSLQQGLFRVPAREFELVVLVIRMTLKHSTWDALLMRHGQLSKTERQELNDLSTAENLAKAEAVLGHLPGLDNDLFALCLQSLQPGCPVWTRVRAGGQLQKTLRTCARRPHWFDLLLKFTRRVWQPIQRRVFRIAPRNRLANGGLFIAVLGGDGSGKTTLIHGLQGWLSDIFTVETLHMGKPAWSPLTFLLRGILKIGTLLRLYPFEGDTYEEESQPHGFPWFVRAVCTARDRTLTYLRARRLSSNGKLVLCDRYSLMGFMNMDGPQCEAALANLQGKSRFLKFLADREKSYYRQIKLPDLLIVLKLDPEIAVRRKTEETAESVRARTAEVWGLEWEKISGFEVDAGRSREETLARVKSIVWRNL